MASKIKGQTMYLPIKPYTLSEGTGEEYNELAVRPDYDDRRKYFYVSIHAGWKSDFGHGCIIMGDSNPLSAPQYVKVMDAPKNSQKYLDQMYQNLEAGKEAIAWLFDHREWQKLNAAVRSIAMNGYLESYRKQMEELINNNTNNQNNSEVMANKTNNNQESVNVQGNAQVENVNVGEATIDNIMPSMSAPVEEEPTKAEETKGDGVEVKQVDVIGLMGALQKNGTAKLSDHATLVVGGVPKPTEKPKVTLRTKTKQTEEPETCNVKPETKAGELAGMLTRVRLTTFTTKRGETAPRIIGFSGEDDPRWKQHYAERMALAKAVKEAKAKDPKAKGQSDPFGASWITDHQTGSVTYCMTFGVRYMDVAKQLVEAYNTTDRNLWKQAEQAVIDTKNGIVAGYQAEKAARQAAREAKKQQATTQPAASQGKTYTAADMEATIREAFGALAGVLKADVKQFEPLIAAAMKKAA